MVGTSRRSRVGGHKATIDTVQDFTAEAVGEQHVAEQVFPTQVGSERAIDIGVSRTCPVAQTIGGAGGIVRTVDSYQFLGRGSGIFLFRIKRVERLTCHLIHTFEVIGPEFVRIVVLGIFLVAVENVFSVGKFLDFAAEERCIKHQIPSEVFFLDDITIERNFKTSVGDGSRIKKAAQSVVNEYMKGKQIVVVVSAVNKTTDELIGLSNDAIGGNLTDNQKAEIMAMGELTSARLFSATIESLGVKSEFIDPYNELWPIMTDSNSLEAKIDLNTTLKKTDGIKQLVNQGVIPVICGFLGKGPSGEITTLGRGGSDITAFLMGHCLDANEVVIVTDVDGVMSTDPNKIEDAELLDTISVEELRDLATHGAQVLHPHALKYKDPLISAKIINFEHGDISAKGTRIVGPFEGEMLKCVTLYKDPISLIAIVGEAMLKKVGLMAKLTASLADENINIYGISAGQNSITVFVDKTDSNKAYHLLHQLVIDVDVLSSLSLGRDTAMITFVSPDIIETPGIISDITEPLRKNNINILEITSSQTAVVLFVDWEDGEQAHKLISEVLE